MLIQLHSSLLLIFFIIGHIYAHRYFLSCMSNWNYIVMHFCKSEHVNFRCTHIIIVANPDIYEFCQSAKVVWQAREIVFTRKKSAMWVKEPTLHCTLHRMYSSDDKSHQLLLELPSDFPCNMLPFHYTVRKRTWRPKEFFNVKISDYNIAINSLLNIYLYYHK